jgi:uncharacterized RDD family membrane protein YckC
MYAGFWKRFVAFMIDNIVITLIYVAMVLLTRSVVENSALWGLLLNLSCYAFGILYSALFESSQMKATPEKWLLAL